MFSRVLLCLLLMLSLFCTQINSRVPYAAPVLANEHDLSSVVATEDIASGLTPRTLVKRHDYVLLCKKQDPPRSNNWVFNAALSRRCLAPPYRYTCNFDQVDYNGREDHDCSLGCVCEQRFANPAPICIKLGMSGRKKLVAMENADPGPSLDDHRYWCLDV